MVVRRVVCVGNELCSDDGVAMLVAQALEACADLAEHLEILRIPEFGLSCLDAFRGAEQIIVVDAVVRGDPAGTCSIVERPMLRPRATCSVGHAISLPSLLELVAHLDSTSRVPAVTVIGIEAEDLTPFSTSVTPAVLAAVPRAVALVKAELLEPLRDENSVRVDS